MIALVLFCPHCLAGGELMERSSDCFETVTCVGCGGEWNRFDLQKILAKLIGGAGQRISDLHYADCIKIMRNFRAE